MRHRRVYQVLIVGMLVVTTGVIAIPYAADAQAQVTCAPGTATFVRAVGPQAAPILVPASLPVTVCTQNNATVAVIPAFQTVGSGMIVPFSLPTKTCAPTAVVTQAPGVEGVTPSLQFQTLGGITIITPVNTVAPSGVVTTGVVTTTAPVISCF